MRERLRDAIQDELPSRAQAMDCDGIPGRGVVLGLGK